jgi:hypothetical protein
MRWLLTTVCCLASLTPALAGEPLASRPLDAPFAIVTNIEPSSFDLLDFREDQRKEGQPRHYDVDPHTFFVVKQHLGIAGGYDNGIAHGSVGYYLTVAEWGRWNFGVPSIEIGVGRYPVYDRGLNASFMKEQMTLLVSLASAHYRVGYLSAWGVHWYINVEQVFDLNANRAGSQIGLSFSTK